MAEKSGSLITIKAGGLGTIIFVIFLILKLTDNAPEWLTWFWVFFPLWIGFAIGFGIFILFLVIAAITLIISERL